MIFANSLTYWMSLVIIPITMVGLFNLTVKFTLIKKWVLSAAMGFGLMLTADLYSCCLLYGLGYANQPFLDFMYNFPNTFLPLEVLFLGAVIYELVKVKNSNS